VSTEVTQDDDPVSETSSPIAAIDHLISVARDTLRELVEQAAAYSGGAGNETVLLWIADQEKRLDILIRRRSELLRKQATGGNDEKRTTPR
jgi:hypothetical protein